MSQLNEKAKTFEEKGKNKNAADSYYKAAQEFLESGNSKEAKIAFIKAIENAEKAQLSSLIVELCFGLSKIGVTEDIKSVLLKAQKPLANLIVISKEKKQYDKLILYSKQKVELLEIVEQDVAEAKKNLGLAYQIIAITNITHKKEEERKKAEEYLFKASEILTEINQIDLKFTGELEVLKKLFSAGFLAKGLELVEAIVSFCILNSVYNEFALKSLEELIHHGKNVLSSKGSKKLINAAKELLSESDPGGALLDKAIENALAISADDKIIDIANIFSETASGLFAKKKYSLAHISFDRAIKLHIKIKSVATAIIIADDILKLAKGLLDAKSKFETGLEFYSLIDQFEAIDSVYLGDKLSEKADEMLKRGKLNLTLENMLNSVKSYLLAEDTKNFSKGTNAIYKTATTLLKNQDLSNALLFVESITEILEGIDAHEQIGKNLTSIAIELVKTNHIDEAEDYSRKAIGFLIKAGDQIGAADSNKIIGEALLRLEIYKSASVHLIDSAKLFKVAKQEDKIISSLTPLVITAKNLLIKGDEENSRFLIFNAAQCAHEKDLLTESKILSEFSEHALENGRYLIAFETLSQALQILDISYPQESKILAGKATKIGKNMISTNEDLVIAKSFIDCSLELYIKLEEFISAAIIMIDIGQLYYKQQQLEIAKELLIQVSKILTNEKSPKEFAEKVSTAGKLLIEYSFTNEGIEQLRKAVGSYLAQAKNKPVTEIAKFCSKVATMELQKDERLSAKHLFIAAMEFSSLVDLEAQDLILLNATTHFLDLKDLYSVREFYDFAKNNLEGEKDYMSKLGRLIVVQGAALRDKNEMLVEATEFINEGVKVLRQVGKLGEAGEAALAQGNAFIEIENFVTGIELIETGAQIFIEINDIERSGDAFLSLTEVNILRSLWKDALKQVTLANKSYIDSKNVEKLKTSIQKTTEIGVKSLTANPADNRDFAISCFEIAIDLSKSAKLLEEEVDIYLKQAQAFTVINDYKDALKIFTQVVQILEQENETIKSPELAKDLSELASKLLLEGMFEIGIKLVDLATNVFMRLGQPINASEVYMKSCNSLLKMNNIVEGVKLVLLASDSLMVADESGAAVKILEEIGDLLFKMKDYDHASIVIGQIVTVHQQTGNLEEQKKAIGVLVDKAIEVIKKGKIMEGENLWEQVFNFSVSTNMEYAMEIHNKRVETLMAAGMHNSTNNAFKQILTILEKDKEQLTHLGDTITNISANLFSKEEYELTMNFIITAVEFYQKAKNSEKGKSLCLSMSQNFIAKGDEKNCIALIDLAAKIANDLEGAHEAAKSYLTSGFLLLETSFIDSGHLAINKAVEIEKQAQNIVGCIELGEIAYKKGSETTNSNASLAIEIYIMAIHLFDSAKAFTRAGDICSIVSAMYFSAEKIEDSIKYSEDAVNYYLQDNNAESASVSTKQSIDSARKLMERNELTKAVHILERGRILVERIGQFDLLASIITIYLNAAGKNLPNRKSSIGIFFLNRAFDLATSSPDPEENTRIINLSFTLALETIRNKHSLAGAKVLELITNNPIAVELMHEKVAETYIEALKATIIAEWNMIGKITRDAVEFFKKTNDLEKISLLVSLLMKRANADILTNSSSPLGYFYLDFAVKIALEEQIPELLLHIGDECFEQISKFNPETPLDISYRMLGFSYQMYMENNSIEYIEKVGFEFVKLGSKDLINNFHSIRGYEALLTARDISIRTQSDLLMETTTMAMLDFAKQLFIQNPRTALSTLEDIIDGLEAFEVPNSNKAMVTYEKIGNYLEALISLGEKLSKNENNYSLGKKIVELLMRILALTRNEAQLEKILVDVEKNEQKYLRKGNKDASYKFRHAGIILIDLVSRNKAIHYAASVFKTANELFQKKKYSDSMAFAEAAVKLNSELGIDAELRNIGMFALNSGDKVIRDGKIHEAMDFYEIAVEAFDHAKDEESSSRLISTIFQTREWDADVTIAYKCYQIASDSAIRRKAYPRAQEIATKCFNRGIAFIDQPRIPSNLTFKFISLAGKTLEDIGAVKEAANAYDNALLKYIRIVNTRKNTESIITELLTKIAVNRMASCDMDSLETIFLRVMELTEMKKSKFLKSISKTLKLINKSEVDEAWNVIAALPFVSHGRIRRIMNSIRNRIVYDLSLKGIFDRTIFSTTDRSLALSEYLIQSLVNRRKIAGQLVNKDVFISLQKIKIIRDYFYSEFELWGRIEVDNLVKEFQIQPNDAASIIRREFKSSFYMSVLNNTQTIFFSIERLKAEISLIAKKERKKDPMFDPMKIATKLEIPPDIIKEVLREISCEEVVEKALES